MVSGGEIEPHVHLDAADRGQVVALRIEEQRIEHRLRGVDRRRLARTHDAVNVEQRVLARHVLVDRQRVADIGADIDVIDVEKRQLLVARLVQRFSALADADSHSLFPRCLSPRRLRRRFRRSSD